MNMAKGNGEPPIFYKSPYGGLKRLTSIILPPPKKKKLKNEYGKGKR